MEKLHHHIFLRLFYNVKLSDLQQEVDLFLQNLPQMLYRPVLDRLQPNSLILSSSPDFLVDPLAQKLGIQGKGSTYAINSQGYLTHIHSIMDGESKAEILSKKLPCTYFSDSLLDLAPLLKATQAVVVRPNRSLRRLAKKNGWEII